MSIATELTTLAANKASIKAAIEAKSPSTAPTDDMSQWPTSIASISGGGSVPYKTRLMWARFDGSDATYINTGITAISGRTIDITARFWTYDDRSFANQIAAGGRTAAGDHELFMGRSANNTNMLMVRRNLSTINNEYSCENIANSYNVVRMKNTPSRVDVWLDGAYRGGKAWSDSTAFNLSVPLYIGKMNGGGWVDWSGMCIYDFKIYDDDHDIMHLIPVIDQNDVVCFYDEVSQSFFYNAGTGSLVAGAVY